MLGRLGGDAKPIHTEDVAVEAAKISPGAFGWARHEGLIDLDHVRMALVSARRKEHGVLVTGSKEKGWMLTSAGVRLAYQLEKQLVDTAQPVDGTHRSNADAARDAERTRVLSSSAYRKWKVGVAEQIDRLDFYEYARVDEYSDKDRVGQKLLRLQNFFGEDPTLSDFVAYMAALAGRVMQRTNA